MSIIIAKNVTASGIEVPDLAGLWIPPYGQVTLTGLISKFKLCDSEDFNNFIQEGTIVLNYELEDLTAQEAVDLVTFKTIKPYATFLDLHDTPATYSGHAGKGLVLNEGGTFFEYTETPLVNSFLDLEDTPTTYSGEDGKYLKVKNDKMGMEFVDAPITEGIGGIKHYQFIFYHDSSHPHAEIDSATYEVLTQIAFLGSAISDVNTVKVVMTGKSEKDESEGNIQIYDIINNNEIIEFTWSGLLNPTWEIITVSGMNNLPTTESVFEIRGKYTNGIPAWLTHMLIY